MILKCINSHLFAGPNTRSSKGWGICPKCGEWGYSIILDGTKVVPKDPSNPKDVTTAKAAERVLKVIELHVCSDPACWCNRPLPPCTHDIAPANPAAKAASEVVHDSQAALPPTAGNTAGLLF